MSYAQNGRGWYSFADIDDDKYYVVWVDRMDGYERLTGLFENRDGDIQFEGKTLEQANITDENMKRGTGSHVVIGGKSTPTGAYSGRNRSNIYNERSDPNEFLGRTMDAQKERWRAINRADQQRNRQNRGRGGQGSGGNVGFAGMGTQMGFQGVAPRGFNPGSSMGHHVGYMPPAIAMGGSPGAINWDHQSKFGLGGLTHGNFMNPMRPKPGGWQQQY